MSKKKEEQEIYLGSLAHGILTDMGHLERWSVDNDDKWGDEITEAKDVVEGLIRKMGIFEK